jgi:hypothetical protein
MSSHLNKTEPYSKINFMRTGNPNLLISKLYWSNFYKNFLIASCYLEERKLCVFNGVGGEKIHEAIVEKGRTVAALKKATKQVLKDLGVDFIELTLNIEGFV